MTTMLSSVSKGKITKPHLVLIYGPDGVGKSTFAAGAPSPLFLSSEDGTNNLDVARLKMSSTADVKSTLAELANEKHDYKTIVIDSLDWLESLIHTDVIVEHGKGIKSIEEIGYGKGRVRAFEMFRDLIPAFNACRTKGLNIVAIGHALVKKFEDPATPQGYERYQIKLQSGAGSDTAGLWREFVDSVLFATYETHTITDDKRRAFGTGARVMYTERRPGFDAKNRHGLPFTLPLSWDAYVEAAVKGEPNSVETMTRQIEGLIEQVKNPETKKAAASSYKSAGKDAAKLAAILNRLEVITKEISN